MGKLFEEFKPTSLEAWKEQIIKDLKGKDISALDFHDPIEEIDFRAYYHNEELGTSELTPGSFPATRGSKTVNNDWNNGSYIKISDATSANQDALKALMRGADLLWFEASENTDWKQVLSEIQLEFIKTQFKVAGINDVKEILTIAGTARNNIGFCFDALEIDSYKELIDLQKESQIASFVVNGFGVQQCGATSWQEIGFCLSVGHRALVTLLQSGLNIDEAAGMIHFHVGIGANYFNEIAKLRSLRMLWSKVIDAYHPQHQCTYNCQITAIVGHTNKSLTDPYTNLLRQTTEIMSATNGADAVIALPYDFYSENGASELANRMALNISLILKEESYLSYVIDPVGGSYSIEKLTDAIARKCWSYFQSLESLGGIGETSALNQFRDDVTAKRLQRQSLIAEGTTTLIGINKYPDPKGNNQKWKPIPSYLGMEPFISEHVTKTSAV